MTSRQLTFLIWALLAGAVVAWQAAAVASKGRLAGFGALVRSAAASRLGLALLVLGWMWLGWHNFAR